MHTYLLRERHVRQLVGNKWKRLVVRASLTPLTLLLPGCIYVKPVIAQCNLLITLGNSKPMTAASVPALSRSSSVDVPGTSSHGEDKKR